MKTNGRLNGLLIIIFSLTLTAVDLVLMIIAFKGNFSVGYQKGEVIALLGALLFLLLLWLFYGIVILFTGEKRAIKKDKNPSNKQVNSPKEKSLTIEQNDNCNDISKSNAQNGKNDDITSFHK